MADIAKKLEAMKTLAGQTQMSEQYRALYQAMEAVMTEIAQQLSENERAFDEYAQIVEDMDAFLADLTSEDEDEPESEEGFDADADEDEAEALLEFECPQCGYRIVYDVQSLAADAEPRCPKCAAPLFDDGLDT